MKHYWIGHSRSAKAGGIRIVQIIFVIEIVEGKASRFAGAPIDTPSRLFIVDHQRFGRRFESIRANVGRRNILQHLRRRKGECRLRYDGGRKDACALGATGCRPPANFLIPRVCCARYTGFYQIFVKLAPLPWVNYRYGLTGYLHWGGNFWTDRPFENVQPDWGGGFLLPAGDNAIVYPDPERDGVFVSERLEVMREGIEDYELLRESARRSPERTDAWPEQ